MRFLDCLEKFVFLLSSFVLILTVWAFVKNDSLLILWEHESFDKREPSKYTMINRTVFESIRYANCWEDADVLLQAIYQRDHAAYLSIGSAGDNSLSLLTTHPSLVLAVDVSLAQIACLELRKYAFLHGSYDTVLEFLGIHPCSHRTEIYHSLREYLSQDSRTFWDTHPSYIQAGIIHCGKFENYFRLFRTKILPFIIGNKKRKELLTEKSESAQREFYQSKMDTWWWRLLFRFFFSRFIMGRLGRHPDFFKYVEGNVATRILQRTEYALTKIPTHTNPYLEYILTGNFSQCLPHYLRKEHFDTIKTNMSALEIFHGTVSEACQKYNPQRFDGFNLSDIFEYMDIPHFAAELGFILQSAHRDARLVYWNMLASRNSSMIQESSLEPMAELAVELFGQDKAFFYKALCIEKCTKERE